MRQSADGYLWIGTEQGLVRFDGLSFTLVDNPLADAAPIGPVRDLVYDGAGNMWMRLNGPRNLLYRAGNFEDPSMRLDLQDITFTAMSADHDGGVLLAGLGDKVLGYRGGRLKTILGAEQSPGTVISMAATPDQSVWLGTEDNGLFRMRQGQLSSVAKGLIDLKINCLFPADSGGVWIGTDHGLHLWEGGALTRVQSLSSLVQLKVLTITKDHDANVWVGTNHGIVRISSSGAVSLDLLDSKPGSEVTAIFEDLDGDIWFGGPRGLERLRNSMFTTYSSADGLPAGGYGAIYVDVTGRTWLAPLSGGLYWMSEGRVGHLTLDGLDRDIVYSISGGDGDIVVGRQRRGLTVLSERGDEFHARTYSTADGLAQNSVYSVLRDRDGTTWAATVSGGVSKLQDGRFRIYSTGDGLVSDSVTSVVEGADGSTWFATAGGLSALSKNKWTSYTSRDGLPSNTIRTIFEDTRHVLWIATAQGLAYLSSGRVGLPPHLPDALREQIFGVAEDAMGMLWFTTLDHVVRVDEERLLNGTLSETDVQIYGVEDGLPEVEGIARDRTVVADRRGRVWLSLTSSLCLADPVLTYKNAVPGAARIEFATVGGRDISPRGPFRSSCRSQDHQLHVCRDKSRRPGAHSVSLQTRRRERRVERHRCYEAGCVFQLKPWQVCLSPDRIEPDWALEWARDLSPLCGRAFLLADLVVLRTLHRRSARNAVDLLSGSYAAGDSDAAVTPPGAPRTRGRTLLEICTTRSFNLSKASSCVCIRPPINFLYHRRPDRRSRRCWMILIG